MKYNPSLHLALLAALSVSACALTPKIDIANYAPIIDLEFVDPGAYQHDLSACRMLAQRAQAAYETERKKDVSRALTASLLGAVAGAVIGEALDDQGDEGAIIGALEGAAVGSAIGGNVDYSSTIAKFGPTMIVDRCMIQRGYSVLNEPGLGGG